MKSIFWVVVFLMSLSASMWSQEAKERKLSMSLGPQNAWFIEIEGADDNMAEKVFYEYIKSHGKMKYNKKAREHFLMSTAISSINGSSPLDIYAKFDDTKTMATAYVWVDMGGAFISSEEHAQQAKALKQWMYEYYLEVRKNVILNEIKEEEKKLSSLERDLKKLVDKNESLHKEIERARQKIAEAESDIEKNLDEQQNKNKEIEGQKDVLNQVNEKLNNLGKKD
jgi:hypothetical protein